MTSRGLAKDRLAGRRPCWPRRPAAQAKSLVYCSEGSPENFSPSINTTGTSLDAARPVYNKLVQFAPGTTEPKPASGRIL